LLSFKKKDHRITVISFDGPSVDLTFITKLKNDFGKTSQGGTHLGKDFCNIKFGHKWSDLIHGNQFYGATGDKKEPLADPKTKFPRWVPPWGKSKTHSSKDYIRCWSISMGFPETRS